MIATVLILLLTIVAVTILASFIIPFVKDNTENTQECFEVLGKLNFYETQFNCYLTEDFNPANVTRTGFSLRVDNDNVQGIRVSLLSGGSSDVIEIVNGATLDNVRMLNQTGFGQELVLPGNGEVRTYVVQGVYEQAEAFAILSNGEICDLSDSIRLRLCSGATALSQVGSP